MRPDERQSTADKALVTEIVDGILSVWEPYHRKWMSRAIHFYALYRNYQDFKSAYNSSTKPRGKDSIIGDAEGEFGPELFIPMCFSTVETILPAMLSASPEMTVLPRTFVSEENVSTMKALLEWQQEQIDYPLRLQTVAKDGLITGLGVQKTFWRQDYRVRPQLAPDPVTGMLVPQQTLQELFDDPDADAVDPFDFIADPFCARIGLADGCFHRTWRSTRYVRRMTETKRWRNLEDLTGDEVKSLASGSRYGEVWNDRRMIGDRLAASGSPMGREDIHEVLEYHDGDRVVTILNRSLVVASGQNPNWHGQLPFQVYRPTEVPHQLPGIGEIEPIEQLQEELNTLRTQRRYNADLVLQRVFAYHDGMVEKEDIQFGPGNAIPVNGPPSEMLYPIQIGDIPNSGYQEEAAIGSDIDRTSGISDVIAGAGMSGGGDTATGVQLVQSAASRRIEAKTRRIEHEIVKPGAEQFVELNQQRIISNRTIPVPAMPTPEEPERRWSWLQLGPDELAGQFSVRPVQNSMQPPNIPQDRADAQMLMTLFGQIPGLEQQKLLELALEKMGVPQPKHLLAPPAPMVPAEVLNRLVEKGVPERAIAESLAQAGGPNLLGDAEPGNIAGPGPEPPGEGGPPVDRPALPPGERSEPEPAASS